MPNCHGRVVDVSPGAAGIGADGAAGRVDRGAAQQRQVDDQRAVGYPEPGRAVAAAPDGDLGAVARGRTGRRLMTSAVSRQRAIAAGCLSIMPL